MAIDVYMKGRLLFAAFLGVAALAVLAWVLWAASVMRTYTIETHDAVSGLIADAPVELHGVEIGKVRKVELIDPTTVRILVSLAEGAPISKATVATIETRGMTTRGFAGLVYVALENSGAASGPLTVESGARYPTIASAPAHNIAMDATMADVTEKVEKLIGLLQTLLDQQTIDALKRTLEGLDKITGPLAANNEHIASLMVYADRDSRDLQPVIQEMKVMLPQLSRATANLESLSRAVTELVTRLSRDPSILLRGTNVPPGPGER